MNQLKMVPARDRFSILRQICNFIPPREVSKIVRITVTEDKSRTFSPWSHVASLPPAQLSHSIGLNDLCDSLQLHSGPLASVRGAAAPSRNGLSQASRERPQDREPSRPPSHSCEGTVASREGTAVPCQDAFTPRRDTLVPCRDTEWDEDSIAQHSTVSLNSKTELGRTPASAVAGRASRPALSPGFFPPCSCKLQFATGYREPPLLPAT